MEGRVGEASFFKLHLTTRLGTLFVLLLSSFFRTLVCSFLLRFFLVRAALSFYAHGENLFGGTSRGSFSFVFYFSPGIRITFGGNRAGGMDD